jgi:thiol-disulfide isomerase/thioredoxin
MNQEARRWKALRRLRFNRHPAAMHVPDEGELPAFDGATGWLNSAPLTATDLRGRVVLVDFWTYTCINWLRTLPYVRAWAEKYERHGLVVIGVHTPEFDVEHDVGNVRRAVEELGVGYPVAMDNDYAVWTAFDNHYWPAVYLADAQGRIRHHHFGEGEYDSTEMILQHLLKEAGAEDLDTELVTVDPGELPRLRPHGKLRLAQRRCPRRPPHLHATRGVTAQPVGAHRGLDDGVGSCRT